MLVEGCAIIDENLDTTTSSKSRGTFSTLPYGCHLSNTFVSSSGYPKILRLRQSVVSHYGPGV